MKMEPPTALPEQRGGGYKVWQYFYAKHKNKKERGR